MGVPSLITKEIRVKPSLYFSGWVMSHVEGNKDEVCILDSGRASVYCYTDDELTGSYSLLATNKLDAIKEYSSILKERRKK